MEDLAKALEKLKYDNRMKDWNIEQGTATKEELENFDKSLEDLSNAAETLELDNRAHLH